MFLKMFETNYLVLGSTKAYRFSHSFASLLLERSGREKIMSAVTKGFQDFKPKLTVSRLPLRLCALSEAGVR